MVCITMDAHSRDIVIGMVRDNVQESSGTFQIVDCYLNIFLTMFVLIAFQWQSQLKHKYRKSPPNASFINRDSHLRGDNGCV